LLQFLLFFLDVPLELCPFQCSLLLLGRTPFAIFFPTPQCDRDSHQSGNKIRNEVLDPLEFG
jgi:hypothetical protein